MTTASHSSTTVERSHLGTLSALAWTGDPDEGHDTPYLIAYSLGDGSAGAEAGEKAALALIKELGLAPGDRLHDLTRANSPIRLLVEAGQAVLTMPHLVAQCPAPPEWLRAVEQRGAVHFMVASRPWPEAAPGRPVTEEVLQNYLGDGATLTSAAHALLPVNQLRR